VRRRLSVLVAGLCAPLLLATRAQAHPDDALTDDPHPAQDSFFHGGATSVSPTTPGNGTARRHERRARNAPGRATSDRDDSTGSRTRDRLRLVADTDDLERSLRDAGLRVTRPRLAVLEAVRAEPHLDTKALISATREQFGAVSHQAVYDVLRALEAAGMVRRITAGVGRALRDACGRQPPPRRLPRLRGDRRRRLRGRPRPLPDAVGRQRLRRRRGRGRLLGALQRLPDHLIPESFKSRRSSPERYDRDDQPE
jgi:hypothetical protein